MESCAVEDVQQDVARAVRNLPDAHAAWQSSWRNAKFREAIERIDVTIYSLDVDTLTEHRLDVLQQAVGLAIKVIEIHVSSLSKTARDADPGYFSRAIARLRAAGDALQQGLSPDPSKRPSEDQRLDRFAAGLKRANLA